jgi:hypothetical protein
LVFIRRSFSEKDYVIETVRLEWRKGQARQEERRLGPPPDLFGRFLVDRASMFNGNNSDDPVRPINAVDNAKPPHLVFAVPLKFSLERLTTTGIGTESTDGLFDTSFQIRRKVADYLSNMEWNIRPKDGHYFARFFT